MGPPTFRPSLGDAHGLGTDRTHTPVGQGLGSSEQGAQGPTAPVGGVPRDGDPRNRLWDVCVGP